MRTVAELQYACLSPMEMPGNAATALERAGEIAHRRSGDRRPSRTRPRCTAAFPSTQQCSLLHGLRRPPVATIPRSQSPRKFALPRSVPWLLS
jgi:hypothetical protein